MSISPAGRSSLPTSDFSRFIDSVDTGGDTTVSPDIEEGPAAPEEPSTSGQGSAEGIATEEFSPGEDVEVTVDDAEEADTEGPRDLSEEELRELRELRQTDRRVRAHEQAHVAAGGQYVRGGPTYEFEEGPDGQRYAVAGEVSLDTSEEGSPEETVQKMRQVRQAALAPANPSSEDRQIAQEAARKKAEAQREMNEEGDEAPEGPESFDEAFGREPGESSESSGNSNPGESRAPDSVEDYTRPDCEGCGECGGMGSEVGGGSEAGIGLVA